MKVKLFAEVGEVEIVELRSADENSEIAQTVRKEKEEAERRAKEERERKYQEQTATILATIASAINAEADKGNKILSGTWYNSKKAIPAIVSYEDWQNCSKYFVPLLENLGYTVTKHDYSKGWTERSGKLGYFDITWYSK